MKANVAMLFPDSGARDKARLQMRELEPALDAVLQCQEALAKLTRLKYLSLIAEGFTEAQALELCK